MDFGATICKPMAPLCNGCVMQKSCVAFSTNQINLLPIKLKQIQKRKRYFDFFIFSYNNKLLLQKRGMNDIWAGLYQFYLVENGSLLPANQSYLQQVLENQLTLKNKEVLSSTISAPVHQLLTHQQLTIRFVEVVLKSKPAVFSKAIWVPKAKLRNFPFPKTIIDFINNKLIA